MRADRLLSSLLLLQAHGQLTGREIAKRLEVSQRTVHRDMEALSSSGVPVFALRGVNGGWRLDEDWRTVVPGLDPGELRALLMSQPSAIGDAGLAASAERALGKLMAAMPTPLRQQAIAMRERLFVDTTGWRGSMENLAMLPIAQDAVARDRKLAFQYCRPGQQPSARVVDALGLVAKGSSWYLVAQSVKGLRTYRISRITEAVVLEAPCERPRDFNLAEHWRASTNQFKEGWKNYEAVLRLAPRAANWIRTWQLVAESAGNDTANADGWSTLRVCFTCIEEASFVIMGLGASVDIVEPASLRECIAAQAASLCQRMRGESQAVKSGSKIASKIRIWGTRLWQN